MVTAVGSTIGALRVVIGADTTGVQRGLRETSTGMARLRRAIVPTIASVAALGAAFTAIAATMYGMARAEMQVIDSQAKLARSIGGTVTGLRAMKLAAEDNGIDGLESSLNRMNRRLGAVEMAGGPAAATVERLGLNIKDLAQMDIDDRLASIADSIHDSGISAQEAARHLQQLGFQQAEATTFFMQGGDAIRAARDEIEAFGLAVDMISAAQIEEANTQLSRMQLVSQGLRTQLAVALAPTLLELSQRFANVARAIMTAMTRVDEFSDAAEDLGANRDIINFAYRSGLAIANLVDTLNKAVLGFSVITSSFKAAWNDIRVVLASTARDTTGISELFNPEEYRKRENEFKQVLTDQAQSLKNTEAARKAYSEAGSFFADAFEEGWAQTLQTITVTPPRLGDDGGDDGGGGGGGGSGEIAEDTEAKQAEELARYRDFLTQRLQMLREFTATEQELEIFKNEQNMELLKEMFQFEIVTAEEYMELREDLEQQHQDRLTEISAAAEQERARNVERWAQFELQQRSAVVNAAVGLLDQFAGESKAAALASIALSKGLAIAEIIQSTAAAQMRAMAELGPLAGPPMAAKIGVMGAVQAGIVAATGLAQAASVSSRGTGGLQGGASGSVGGRSSAPSSGGMGYGGGGASTGPRVNINLIEDRDRAGQVDVNRSDDEEVDADVFVADIRGGGPRSQALQETFNLRRTGS